MDGLCDPDRAVFLKSIEGLVSTDLQGALLKLGKTASLAARERDLRIKLLVGNFGLSRETVLELIESIRSAVPEILNAFRTALPSEYRPLATAKQGIVSPPPQPMDGLSLNPVTKTRTIEELSPKEFPADRFKAVILVGTDSEHHNNKALLQSSDLDVLQVPQIQDLLEISTSGMCGFVVAPSAWLQLDGSLQLAAIESLLNLSTFLFARIATSGLEHEVAACLNSTIARIRCGNILVDRCCQSATADLSPADINSLTRCAQELSLVDTANCVPLGMSGEELTLMKLVSQQRLSGSPTSLKRLAVGELHGGRSGARLYLLQGDTQKPFVIKFGTHPSLCEELTRHRRWINDWETEVTEPRLYLHLGASAISYRLQSNVKRSGQPAPTLESAMYSLRQCECYPDPAVDSEELSSNLEYCLEHAANLLGDLNEKTVAGETGDEFWLHWASENLARTGVTMKSSFPGIPSNDRLQLIAAARSFLSPFDHSGLVHGDVHARNILLIDRRAAFIDFASSGPGNPFIDLLVCCLRRSAVTPR